MSALITFALTTGMRPQEYLGLKWSDVDRGKGTATVRRAIVWGQTKGVGWHFDKPKTTAIKTHNSAASIHSKGSD